MQSKAIKIKMSTLMLLLTLLNLHTTNKKRTSNKFNQNILPAKGGPTTEGIDPIPRR